MSFCVFFLSFPSNEKKKWLLLHLFYEGKAIFCQKSSTIFCPFCLIELGHGSIHDTVNSLAEAEDTRAVRRNDAGFVGTLADDVSENVSFRRNVQCRGGFIQKQHRGIAKDGTGDGKPLGLAFGETAATFPDAAVDGIRQMLNKNPRRRKF